MTNEERIYNIAKAHIVGLDERGDLKEHKSDNEDFLDVSVWSLEAALKAAYEQGKKDAK